MTDEVRERILKWIFDNHDHHTGYYGENGVESEIGCEDAEEPYVNSLELEKFIKTL